MSTFEDRLWTYLAEAHGAEAVRARATGTPAQRRARVWRGVPWSARATTSALAAMAAVAVLAVVLVSATAETPPAYALTRHADGSITVTIHDLQTAIPALNRRLAAMGVDETVIPITESCPTQTPMQFYPQSAARDTLTFTVHEGRKYLRPGFDGVLAAGYTRERRLLIVVGAYKPPLPRCFSADPTTIVSNRAS